MGFTDNLLFVILKLCREKVKKGKPERPGQVHARGHGRHGSLRPAERGGPEPLFVEHGAVSLPGRQRIRGPVHALRHLRADEEAGPVRSDSRPVPAGLHHERGGRRVRIRPAVYAGLRRAVLRLRLQKAGMTEAPRGGGLRSADRGPPELPSRCRDRDGPGVTVWEALRSRRSDAREKEETSFHTGENGMTGAGAFCGCSRPCMKYADSTMKYGTFFGFFRLYNKHEVRRDRP